MTLLEIERLARKIVAALQSPPDAAVTLKLAEDFANACRVTNARLRQCEAMLDIRYLPGTDGEAVIEHLRRAMREVEGGAPGVRMELEILSHQPPTLVPQDHPLAAELARRAEEVTGVRPVAKGESGATVAKFLILRGIPTVGFSCGPDGADHRAGEYIDLAELARFAEVMTRVVIDLLKGKP